MGNETFYGDGLNGKRFDFAVSDQLKITYITTDESIPVKAVMAGNYWCSEAESRACATRETVPLRAH